MKELIFHMDEPTQFATEARAQEAKILTTRTDHQPKNDPKHKNFWEKAKLPLDADDSYVCRGKGIEAHKEVSKRGQAKVDNIVMRACKDPTTRWIMLVELVWRRLVCESRDESPSSNLGRVKQGEAIRADGMVSQVECRSPQRRGKRAARTRAALTQS